MNKKITKLLIKSFDKDLSTDKKKLLIENLKIDKKMQNKKHELKKIRELIKKQNYEFKPYFETRVMSKIESAKNEIDFISRLFFIYQKIIVFSVSAVFILLILFYLTGNPLPFENLFGTKYMNTDNLSAFLMFD